MRKIRKQFNDYLDYCANIKRLSPQTVRGLRWTFNDFCKRTDVDSLEEITNDQIVEWVKGQTDRGVCARSINTRLRHLLRAIRYYDSIGLEMSSFNTKLVPKTNA